MRRSHGICGGMYGMVGCDMVDYEVMRERGKRNRERERERDVERKEEKKKKKKKKKKTKKRRKKKKKKEEGAQSGAVNVLHPHVPRVVGCHVSPQIV